MLCLLTLIFSSALVTAFNTTTTAAPPSGSQVPQPPEPGCTTLEPIFQFIASDVSYTATTTVTSSVDCQGCNLVTTTFNYGSVALPPQESFTGIVTTVSTSIDYSCIPSTSTKPYITTPIPSIAAPTVTSSPVPPVSPEALELINELRTVDTYVKFIANGGFQDDLCSLINVPALSNGTGINATAVQDEVCNVALLQKFYPALSVGVIELNQINTATTVEFALYAVQVAAGYGGIMASKFDLQKLCDEIDAGQLNGVFAAYITGQGAVVKDFVCSAAAAKRKA